MHDTTCLFLPAMQTTKEVVAGLNSNDIRHGTMQNNYSRPGGQVRSLGLVVQPCLSAL